ncbi:MAG: sulfatase [marine bacterium B5-7]|nr:MAG: sulfatase [marine bacterium B5-7]
MAKNILFIMCDQLRADYLGCYGHPHIKTPVIDALAKEGVRFDNAFCNAPVCGSSRASFYTGRYVISHGANYNNFPLRIDEHTIGDYLAPLGVRTALVGKTHMKPDISTMNRMGIDSGSELGIHLTQTGFEPFERDDGLHPMSHFDPDLAYNRYLREQGYQSDNPWNDFANASVDDDGAFHSGWFLRNARRPARVSAEHSESAYMTDRAMDFIDEAGDDPWCLHLSYIKPHWPYMAPSPYHDLYGDDDVVPSNRSDAELNNQNPVVAAFRQHRESQSFSNDHCRHIVIPTYMGLIHQIDDELGRLFAQLRQTGRWDDTLIVLTSDHGDFLGDHWLGEKELFYEESVRIPMIIRDPTPDADTTRGAVCEQLVEAIDLLPTFIESLGGSVCATRLEGRSLMPLINSTFEMRQWRDAVFSEFDFCLRRARKILDLEPGEARGFMVRTTRYKYVHYPKHPPQLFDLERDPQELLDLGMDPGYENVRAEMRERLLEWFALRHNRTTVSNEIVEANTARAFEQGFVFGTW